MNYTKLGSFSQSAEDAPIIAVQKHLSAMRRANVAHSMVAKAGGTAHRTLSPAVEQSIAGAVPDHRRQVAEKAEGKRPLQNARVAKLDLPSDQASLLDAVMSEMDRNGGHSVSFTAGIAADQIGITRERALVAKHELIARKLLRLVDSNLGGGSDCYRAVLP